MFLYTSTSDLVKGFTNSSRLFINFKTILLADFGPKPGNFEINFISTSISLVFCIYYNGHLKPGIPNPPAVLEISSLVFSLNFDFALL